VFSKLRTHFVRVLRPRTAILYIKEAARIFYLTACVRMFNTCVHNPMYMHAWKKAELTSFSYLECDLFIKASLMTPMT